jgi:hypothetical protein
MRKARFWPPRSCEFVAMAILLVGCPSRESVGTSAVGFVGAGVVNNPGNKSLRFDILKFGLERFCHEMTRGGAPLRLNDDEPVLGRFFAASCQSQTIDEEERKSFIVRYSGRGYAWTNVTGRVGFTTEGLVEYAPDFQMHDEAMYVYFLPRLVDPGTFRVTLVENDLARAGMSIARVDPAELGRRIVESQLRRGFTVIRYDASGETDFGLGLVPKGQKPFKPFIVKNSDKRGLANDRTEVQNGQQDYIGGFEVEDDGQALFLTLLVDGAAAVDVSLLPKFGAEQMIDAYVQNAGPRNLAAPARFTDRVAAGALWQRAVEVPAGVYYVVADHSSVLGATAPDAADGAAKVDYLIQLGDAR